MQQSFPTYCLRRDGQGRWTWHFEVADGDAAATSHKSYATAAECIEAIKQLKAVNAMSLAGTLDDLLATAGAAGGQQPVMFPTPAQEPEPAPTDEPLDLSPAQVLPQAEPEVAEPPVKGKGANGLTSKKAEDVVITHLRRLQRESGTN